MLTGREIMMRTVKFESVPRTPVAIIDGGVWMARRAGVSFENIFDMPDFGTELVADTFQDIKSDIVWVCAACYSLGLRALGAKVDFTQVGEGPEVIEPLISQPEDILNFDANQIKKKFLDDPGMQAMLEQTRRISRMMSAERCVAINYVGPFTIASQILGVSEFMMALFGEPETLDALLSFSVRMCYEFYDLFLSAGADTVFIGDPCSSGDLISPAVFDQNALPYLIQLNHLLEGKALFRLLHICGNTKSRLLPLKESGIEAFSLDSVDITEAMKKANGSYAIFGNMSPVDILNDKTPDAIFEICSRIAQEGGLKGGFALMPGCDLPPMTPLENIQAMINAAYENKA